MTTRTKPLKRGTPIWPTLPCDQDRIKSVLSDWAQLAGKKISTHVDNSPITYIEWALVLWLAPYTAKRGFDSTIFQDSNELMHSLTGHVFERGYPLMLAETLSLCYSFERPWEMTPECASKYAHDLGESLKNIALARAEGWKEEAAAFKSGRKPDAKSTPTKYVENFINKNIGVDAGTLWKNFRKAIENDDDGSCPFEFDSKGEELIKRTGKNKSYTEKTFKNAVSKLKKSKKK